MKIQRRECGDDSFLTPVIADPILRRVLVSRKVSCLDDLDTSLAKIISYKLLRDATKAAEIIADHIMRKQHIMVCGDYDMDGMSGTALGVRALKAFGLNESLISYYVPSRYDGGYGINEQVVAKAFNDGVKLIITVDNGIAAFDAAAYAAELGLKLIITDHHEVQHELPIADVVVNPKRHDDNFPSKHLSGVGVLFYVMAATRAQLLEKGYYATRDDMPNMGQFLDLVALGTVGDVMSFDSNNRRLIKAGLKRINAGSCTPGILAMLELLRLDPSKINARSIGFDLCPRFNAATRIKIEQNPAILNLLSQDMQYAMYFAKQLDMCNKRRMDHERVMFNRANTIFQEESALNAFNHNLKSIMSAYNATKTPTNDPTDSDVLSAPDHTPDHASTEVSASPNAEAPSSFAAVDTVSSAIASEGTALAGAGEMAVSEEVSLISEVASIGSHGIVIYDPCFLTGLVGLVANKMRERYSRPCMIFGGNVGAGKGGSSELMQVFTEANKAVVGEGELEDRLAHAQKIYDNLKSETGRKAKGMAEKLRRAKIASQNDDREEMNKNPVSIDEAVAYAQQMAQLLPDHPIVGSARSVPNVNLIEVFDFIKSKDSEIFIACGGHAMAAGATIRVKDLPKFKVLFDLACQEVAKDITSMEEEGVISDGDLPDSHFCLEFARDLERIGPWGKDFEEPKFDGFFTIESVVVLKNAHLKVMLRTDTNKTVEAIKFRASQKEKSLSQYTRVHVLYSMGINRYNGNERLQLTIDTIEAA